jgi:poly(hydroxyalkanoate) granule-associated protein
MAETAPEQRRRPTRKATTKRRNPTAHKPAPAVPAAAKWSPASSSASGNSWIELVMSVVHTPVGMAASQADRLVSELVRTGSLGQREAERLLSELKTASDRAQVRAQQESSRLDRFIEGRIEDVLNRVNIPSRSDIERLNASVDLLTAKVQALVSRQAKAGGPR